MTQERHEGGWTRVAEAEMMRMSASGCVVKTELSQQHFLKDWIRGMRWGGEEETRLQKWFL